MDRRQFAKLSSATAAGLAASPWVRAAEAAEVPLQRRPEAPLQLRYIVAMQALYAGN